MNKRVVSIIMIILIFIMASVPPAYTANGSTTVTVTLPTFKVVFNNTNVDNRYSKYPLIVYNDITYFPMTYSDCRFLGLETKWK